MKEAIGNVGVTNFVIIFIIILLIFFVGSLAYSKASKVKNRIIDEIEKDQGYDSNTQTEIEKWMKEIGYRVNFRQTDNHSNCPSASEELGGSAKLVNNSSRYQYCVYEVNTCNRGDDSGVCGTYYRVITYMYFDFPVISQMIQIPVRGDSMTFTSVKT